MNHMLVIIVNIEIIECHQELPSSDHRCMGSNSNMSSPRGLNSQLILTSGSHQQQTMKLIIDKIENLEQQNNVIIELLKNKSSTGWDIQE